MKTGIDHSTHGWALLAMKLPQIRRFRSARHTVAELLECYSLAVLHLGRLRNSSAPLSDIGEYETVVSSIEGEVFFYLKEYVELSRNAFDWCD